jgi:Ca2+-binding RTX toxin-like protein
MATIVNKVVELSGAPGTTDTNGNDFDLLREAVLTAGLAGALSNPGASLTVFAPTDAAFVKLAKTLGYQGVDEAGSLGHIVDALTLLGGGNALPLLQSVLTYHVAPGKLFLSDVVALGNGAIVPTLQGGSLTVDLTAPGLVDLDPALPNPKLIGFDVDAGNGVIHVLDGVLLPLAVSAILSQPGTDFIIGGANSQIYHTLGGNDFVDGNGGNDIIHAGSGNDVAIGGDGHDFLTGGTGNDILIGENGADALFGGSGSDVITGGAGRDQINGGSGADRFVFTTGSGHDTLTGFENGHDKIDLSGYGIESFSEIAHAVKAGWFGTSIKLSSDSSIFLAGTWKHQIDASDFIFA